MAEAFASETKTISSTAVGLTASTYAPAAGGPQVRRALITVDDASIRWWADGSTPTPSTGHLSNAGDIIELSGPNDVRNFLSIRTGATDAKLQVTYER